MYGPEADGPEGEQWRDEDSGNRDKGDDVGFSIWGVAVVGEECAGG